MRTVTEKIHNRFCFLNSNKSNDYEALTITTDPLLSCNIRQVLTFLASGSTHDSITEVTHENVLPDCNLIPLALALNLLTNQQKKTHSVSENHAALLCKFIASVQRIVETLQWIIDVINKDEFFLTLKELLALLVDLPECIFCFYGITRHSCVWETIQWEFHSSRFMVAVLHIWNEKTNKKDFSIREFSDVDTKREIFLLVETTCYIIARQKMIFPFYWACYFSLSYLTYTKYVLSSFSITPAHQLPELIHNITKNVNKNSQAIKILANLLIGAISTGIQISKSHCKGFTFFGAPELIDLIFPCGLNHNNTLHYSSLTLKCLSSFIYAVDDNDEENNSFDLWYSLWSALTCHHYSCAYIGVLLVDALWFDLINLLVLEKKSADAITVVNADQNSNKAKVLVAQRLGSLEKLWECMMRPVITDISPLSYLVITLAKLRLLLNTRNVLRSNILADYGDFEILRQISFKVS
jgi:hypothetical protein